jgi:hypothetical protein
MLLYIPSVTPFAVTILVPLILLIGLSAHAEPPCVTESVTSEGSSESFRGLAVGGDGTLFISSLEGGVYKILPDGTKTILIANPGDPPRPIFRSHLLLDTGGNLYISESQLNRVIRITTDGMMTVVAGVGSQGFSGDGGGATEAELSFPTALALDSQGRLLI